MVREEGKEEVINDGSTCLNVVGDYFCDCSLGWEGKGEQPYCRCFQTSFALTHVMLPLLFYPIPRDHFRRCASPHQLLSPSFC